MTNGAAVVRQPVLAVSHGAAGLTLAPGDRTRQELRAAGAVLARSRPSSIVVVSAHWRTPSVGVASGPRPTTVHDHPLTAVHDYRYRAVGDPDLAATAHELLVAAGLKADLVEDRGRDHGAWIPLSLLRPAADLPVVQISLLDVGPAADEQHLALGRALAPLRELGVLIVTSGGVTHDQQEFRRRWTAGSNPQLHTPESARFAAWTDEVLTGPSRTSRLQGWRRRPDVERLHPTDEHFLPFVVAVGAAGDHERCERLFAAFQHDLCTSAYRFG